MDGSNLSFIHMSLVKLNESQNKGKSHESGEGLGRNAECKVNRGGRESGECENRGRESQNTLHPCMKLQRHNHVFFNYVL